MWANRRRRLKRIETLLESVLSELNDSKEREIQIMSAISDYAARVQASFDRISTGIDGLAGDIASLKALVDQLQNSPGAIDPADQALLDQIEAMASGLGDRITALDAETPPVP